MDIFLGGVLFALFIAAQALALIFLHPLRIEKSRRPASQPDNSRSVAKIRDSIRVAPGVGLSERGRRLLQP
jgi:hypothetical protein